MVFFWQSLVKKCCEDDGTHEITSETEAVCGLCRQFFSHRESAGDNSTDALILSQMKELYSIKHLGN